MAGGAWRRGAARVRTLRVLLRDTARALQDAQDILAYDPEIPDIVQSLTKQACRPTALVILGCSPSARARLLNCILGRRLLPESLPRGCRWLRVQYGASTQVHLSVGNSEFELVEELECNRKQWETLPLQDLLRQDNDMGTTLEVELNNSFLKDGLKIIVPPDIAEDPGPANYITLKKLHTEFYKKRDTVLKTYSPVYLYALDKFGTNVFSENIMSKMTVSRSEEDFWSTFNLYYMTKVNNDNDVKVEEERDEVWKEGDDSAVFSSENCLDLHQIKEINVNAQVLFVLFSNSEAEEKSRNNLSEATESTELCNTEELPESDQGLVKNKVSSRPIDKSEQSKTSNRRLQEEQTAFMNELLDQWELISNPPPKHHVKSQCSIIDDLEILKNSERQENDHGKKKKDVDIDRTVKSRSSFLNTVIKFATECSQSYLLDQCTKLSEIHVKLLQQFMLASFDMARELQIVPKKIQYVARQEQQLYETMSEKFFEGEKKQELLQIMQEVLQEMKSEINNMDWSVDDLPRHQDRRYATANSVFYARRASPDSDTAEEAVCYENYNMDDYEIIDSADESLCCSEAFDTSTRAGGTRAAGGACAAVSTRRASLDVQRTVLSKLSRKISLKLVSFVDCLKDTYFGTLQRCLESLEGGCRRELGGRPASEAMRQLLCVARQVDLTPCASFSLLSDVLDSLRRLLCRLRLAGDAQEACCALSAAWRRRAALHCAHSLAPQRLARLISLQILERLSVAHERYQSALASLETALASHLHHTEDIKLAIRKKYAPSFARLCLESTSMCDLLMYGTPELGREIGRGQYGVVYAVRGAWAGHSPAAVKSVLPADERHYHELAMEFFYTRSIPAHPRIVRLLGSLVQRGGGAPGVLLVSQRRARDLHAAVRAGLSFAQRMRIACDIVEGIRYLHSLGLVHRDVKLKNVLLDERSRAALSDLGFCAAEALLSGSLVGTPVHMAPELLAGMYRAAVDVYAFGILFWYLCAGNIKLPSAFETFQNKEQLWSKVKRGLRPERLPHFSDECWEVMESCWASEPSQRALLGDVQPKLEAILQKALDEDKGHVTYEPTDYKSEDDSLDMTGLDVKWENKCFRPEHLPHFSDECWDVMESCWASEPSQRALLGDVQPKLEAILQKALDEDKGHVTYEPTDYKSEDDSLEMTGLDEK
ncbi:dual serine/threonine and tyrosine protein kinase-like isoform X2 [Nymphalis io]|uniref:dual serine/threonine and tyrosine protein kinase-like isoform X2 n=1 Tax=Inachis io TaxID=171585 RepID=UPI002167DFF2|nr:dual serine/threonine and tyrosine protein kinase-like isoform X2 [Nymphalis io]